MSKAERGNSVAFHYTGSLEDGTVFDSSEGREPLRITVGNGELIRGVDEALEGMAPGEEKTVTIGAEEAYGPRRTELVQQIDRGQIPPHIEVVPGTRLEARDPNGQPIHLTVVEAGDTTVTLDANHPLAGEDLKFELKVVDVA